MRIRVSLAKGLLIALVFSLIPISAISAQKITPGSSCKVYKEKVGYKNKIYTCIKSGKRLLWNKGVLIPVSKPPASASASVAPTEPAKPVEIADPELSSKSIYADASMCQLKSSITTEADLGYQMDSTFLSSIGNVNLAIIYTTYTDAAGDDRAFSEYEKVQFQYKIEVF